MSMQFTWINTQPLPHLNPSTTVLDAILPRAAARFLQHHVFVQCRTVIIGCFGIGLLHYAVFPFVPVAMEQNVVWLATWTLPYYVMAVGEARAHVLTRLMMQTYEFWFLQTMNCILAVAFAIYLADLRIIVAICTWIGAFAGCILDAAQFQSFYEVLLPLWTVVVSLPPLIAVFFNLFESPNDLALLQFRKHTLSVREVIVNCIGTIATLALRHLYLYYKVRTNRANDEAMTIMAIKSFSYRCTIRLEPVTNVSKEEKTVQKSSIAPSHVQMQLIPPKPSVCESDHVVARPLHTWFSQSPRLSWVVLVLLILLSWGCMIWSAVSSKYAMATSILALIFTIMASGMLVGLCQIDLLKRLCGCFDVVFLSVQFTIAHMCVGDFVYWQWSLCLVIACSWCWMHLVLISDALIPFLTFHIQARKMVSVILWSLMTMWLILMIGMQVVITLDLLYWQSWQLQDRLLFSFSISSTKVTSLVVVSCFFGRIVTLVPWCLRLLLRHVCRLQSNELLILKGSTQYDGQVPYLKPLRHFSVGKSSISHHIIKNQVQPFAK